jgi:hypothetical protein
VKNNVVKISKEMPISNVNAVSKVSTASQRGINPVHTQIVVQFLAQAIFRQGIQVESLHRTAEAAELSITGIPVQ